MTLLTLKRSLWKVYWVEQSITMKIMKQTWLKLRTNKIVKCCNKHKRKTMKQTTWQSKMNNKNFRLSNFPNYLNSVWRCFKIIKWWKTWKVNKRKKANNLVMMNKHRKFKKKQKYKSKMLINLLLKMTKSLKKSSLLKRNLINHYKAKSPFLKLVLKRLQTSQATSTSNQRSQFLHRKQFLILIKMKKFNKNKLLKKSVNNKLLKTTPFRH